MFVRSSFALLAAACALSSSSAHAHVSLTSGPGYVNQSQVLNFGVGHGCEGADTVRIEISLPKEATNVRAMPSVFGPVEVKPDDTGVPATVIWSKDKARAADDLYYQLSIRIKVPDAPFTTLYFPAKQVCRSADGKETTVNWSALPGDPPPEGDAEVTPAPALVVLPVRYPGWNKLTVTTDIKDLKVFDDAQIVWSGDAAYSSNPATADLIKSEDGVKQLSEIKSGSEIWVKY